MKTTLDLDMGYTTSVQSISRTAARRDRDTMSPLPANSMQQEERHDDLNALLCTAHELVTPLTSLSVSSEMLAPVLGAMDWQLATDLVQKIRRSTIWMRWLVDNWLSVAEVDRGSMSLRRQPFDIIDVASEVCAMLEPLITQHGQQITVRRRGPHSIVTADPRRIQQVLLNLVTNASKFGGEGTRITILANSLGDRVRVSVADEGPGVSAEDRRTIFRPFTRAREAIQSDKKGYGLGLAIVQAIIATHGGRVGVQNRRGGGARFWFEL